MALWAAMGVVAGALAYAFACAVALEFSVGGVLIALAAGAFAGAYASRTRAVRMMALRAGISVGRRAVRRNGHTPALQAGGADLVVSDLAELLRDP